MFVLRVIYCYIKRSIKSSKTLEMIQLQVHLQLPCYDFCFLY